MTLPSTGLDCVFLIAHCFGSAFFAMAKLLAQQMASLMRVSLAHGFQLVFYFISQYSFFFESSTSFDLVIEVTGTMLVVISACMDPIHKLVTHNRVNKTIINSKLDEEQDSQCKIRDT